MKKILTCCSVCLLILVSRGPGQTVDEVINKYIDAMGGIEKLRSLKSLYMEGITVMSNGNEITSHTYKVQDKLYRREIEFGMGSVTMVVTDKEGWSSNPRTGGAFEPMTPEMLTAQQGELDIAGPLVDYAAKGHKAELMGKDTINGMEAYKIKLALKSGRDLMYYIDTKNNYIIRQSFKGGEGMFGGRGRQGASTQDGVIIDYSDYQKTSDGFVFPYKVSIAAMGAGMTFEKIEVNKPIDAKFYKHG